MTYREQFRPLIAGVVASGLQGRDLRRAIRRVCPIDPVMRARGAWSYRVWRDEVAIQTGRTRPIPFRRPWYPR